MKVEISSYKSRNFEIKSITIEIIDDIKNVLLEATILNANMIVISLLPNLDNCGGK